MFESIGLVATEEKPLGVFFFVQNSKQGGGNASKQTLDLDDTAIDR